MNPTNSNLHAFLVMGQRHVLQVPGRYEKIKTICKFVAKAAAESGLDETAVFHVELACDEACTNIIEHAYGAEDVGDIKVSWQVQGDDFTITIHDNGDSFDPDNITPSAIIPEATDPANDLRAGGLGLHFMRKLMDEIHFDLDSEKGNTLVMVKKIKGG